MYVLQRKVGREKNSDNSECRVPRVPQVRQPWLKPTAHADLIAPVVVVCNKKSETGLLVCCLFENFSRSCYNSWLSFVLNLYAKLIDR